MEFFLDFLNLMETIRENKNAGYRSLIFLNDSVLNFKNLLLMQ